jgi:hypothetical protein
MLCVVLLARRLDAIGHAWEEIINYYFSIIEAVGSFRSHSVVCRVRRVDVGVIPYILFYEPANNASIISFLPISLPLPSELISTRYFLLETRIGDYFRLLETRTGELLFRLGSGRSSGRSFE